MYNLESHVKCMSEVEIWKTKTENKLQDKVRTKSSKKKWLRNSEGYLGFE